MTRELLTETQFTSCSNPSQPQREPCSPDFEQLQGPVLQSVAEFRESVAVASKQYLRVAHLTEEDLLCHPLEREPSSVTLGVRNAEGVVVTRASLVVMGKPDWSSSLPCCVQPEFAELVENTRGPKAEVTRLASDPDNCLKMTRTLMDDIALMSLALDVHSLFLVCHPKHEDFYISCFEADPLKTVDSYTGVSDKPGTLMKITPADFYHFTRWTPKVIEEQVASPIGEELFRMKQLYGRRVQAAGLLANSNAHNSSTGAN